MSDKRFLRAAQAATTPAERRAHMRSHKRLKIQNQIAECRECSKSWRHVPDAATLSRAEPRPLVFTTGKKKVEQSIIDPIIEAAGYDTDDYATFSRLACRKHRETQLNFSGAWVVVNLDERNATDRPTIPQWGDGRIHIGTVSTLGARRAEKTMTILKRDIGLAYRIINGLEWPEPVTIIPLANDKDGQDLVALLDGQGYAVLDSWRVQDRVVVTETDQTKVPIKYVHHVRYSLPELVRIGELGRGHRISTAELNSVHLVKKIGGTIVR